jgi:hypothetical protein
MPGPHPAEFRQRAISPVRADIKPIGQLQISQSFLRDLLAQADAGEGGRPAQLNSGEMQKGPISAGGIGSSRWRTRS